MDALAAELARARARSKFSSSVTTSTGIVQRGVDGRMVFVRGAATAAAAAASLAVPSASTLIVAPLAEGYPVSMETVLSNTTHPKHTISSAAVCIRLRLRDVPITYFGESDAARRDRLFEMEGDSSVLLLVHASVPLVVPPNVHAPTPKRPREEAVEGAGESSLTLPLTAPYSEVFESAADNGGDRADEEDSKSGGGGGGGIPATTHLVAQAFAPAGASGDAHLYLFHFWRGILKEWAAELDARPVDVSSTAVGTAALTAHQSAVEAMRPFFSLCRARALPPVIRDLCVEVVDHIFARNYMVAGDAYLRLAVGKGQWVIGVSQVGIHERASRERLYAGKIMHVMNDEAQRRYITTLKRLMTWVQTKYPPTDPSRAFRP